MKTYRFARRMLTGFTIVTWLGAVAMLVLATVIGARTSLAVGLMAGVVGTLLTLCALTLIQIGQAILDIAQNSISWVGSAEENEAEAELVEEPKTTLRAEPHLQSCAEPQLYRSGAEPGVLRAVRA